MFAVEIPSPSHPTDAPPLPNGEARTWLSLRESCPQGLRGSFCGGFVDPYRVCDGLSAGASPCPTVLNKFPRREECKPLWKIPPQFLIPNSEFRITYGISFRLKSAGSGKSVQAALLLPADGGMSFCSLKGGALKAFSPRLKDRRSRR